MRSQHLQEQQRKVWEQLRQPQQMKKAHLVVMFELEAKSLEERNVIKLRHKEIRQRIQTANEVELHAERAKNNQMIEELTALEALERQKQRSRQRQYRFRTDNVAMAQMNKRALAEKEANALKDLELQYHDFRENLNAQFKLGGGFPPSTSSIGHSKLDSFGKTASQSSGSNMQDLTQKREQKKQETDDIDLQGSQERIHLQLQSNSTDVAALKIRHLALLEEADQKVAVELAEFDERTAHAKLTADKEMEKQLERVLQEQAVERQELLMSHKREEEHFAQLEAKDEELQAKSLETAVILNAMVDPMIVTDTEGVIRMCNQAVAKLFGYKPGELTGQNVSILCNSTIAPRHDMYIQRYLRTGKAHIIGRTREVLTKHKNGSLIWMCLSVVNANLEGKRLFIGNLHDVSTYRNTWATLNQRMVHFMRISRTLSTVTNQQLQDSSFQLDNHMEEHAPVETEFLSKEAQQAGLTSDLGVDLTTSHHSQVCLAGGYLKRSIFAIYAREDPIPMRMVKNVYLGSVGGAMNLPWLQENNITHILVVDDDMELPTFFLKQFSYKHVHFQQRTHNLAALLSECCSFIDEARMIGKVLVHGLNGNGLETMAIIAFLTSHGWDWDLGMQHVMSKRVGFVINPDWQATLVKFCQVYQARKKGEGALKGPGGTGDEDLL